MPNSELPTTGTQAVPAEIVNRHRQVFGDEDTFRLALQAIADETPEAGRAFQNHRGQVVAMSNIARLALGLPIIH